MKEEITITLTQKQYTSITALISMTEIYRKIQIDTWEKITNGSNGKYKDYADSNVAFLKSMEKGLQETKAIINHEK